MSTETLTAAEIEEHRSWHELEDNCCSFCERPWPCSPVQVFDAQAERIRTLETALRRHGVHGPECVSFVPTVFRECKCGLSAALEGEPKP